MSFVATAESYSDLWKNRSAISEDGKSLQKSISSIRIHNEDSIYLGWRRQLKERVEEYVERCSKDGWDGEDAFPILNPSKKMAELFIDLIPESVVVPDVEPENTGNFSFDWNEGKNRIFSISIYPDKAIFAGILGSEKLHGEVIIQDEMPEKIDSLLVRYFRR